VHISRIRPRLGRATGHGGRRHRRWVYRLSMAGALAAASGVYAATGAVTPSSAATSVNVWLTTPNKSALLAEQTPISFGNGGSGTVITVNPNTTYQSMVGFGGSLTDSAASNIWNSSARTAIMNALFSTTSGIGLSWLRQPIGSPDFTAASSFYSYDDGSADPTLSRFSIAHDQAYIIPLLQEALSLNPQLSMMATPWSAPGWMKTTGSMVGGDLISGDEGVFAQYLTKFVQAYQAAGIPISYLTVANEPAYSPAAYPGMLMAASQESTVINDLAPDLSNAGLNTKILAWDHNWDVPSYPESVLSSSAGNNVAGVAWHCYGGAPSAMTTVHNLYPSKDTFETECSGMQSSNTANTFADQLISQGANLAINSVLNWARTVTLWNLALNPSGGPVIGNGCTCTAPVTVNGGSYTLNAEYYVLGHFSKFVRPGAVRIASTAEGSGGIDNVAFRDPDGTIVLVAVNTNTSAAQSFQVSYDGSTFGYSMPAGSMATFTWPSTVTGGGGGTTASGTITGYQGLCLDVRSASSADGTPVQVYTCNGTTAQQWTVASNGTLQALGKCLDVSGGGTANGTLVQLYTCNGTGAQTWQAQSNGELVNPQSGKCLDDTGFGSSGTQVQIWSCTDASNQQWKLP
jgi:glucosylceramidase